MIRLTFIFLLGFSMLLSSPVQAGHRNGFNHKHHSGHHKKHHGHHYYSRSDRRHQCRHDSHYRNAEYVQYYATPRVVLNATFGFSTGRAMIIYQPYPQGIRGY